MKFLRIFIIYIAFWSHHHVQSQQVNLRFGVGIDFGSEIKRIGLRFDIGSHYEFVQANIFTGVYYNFSSWGIQSKTPEIKLGGAAHFGFGKKSVNNFRPVALQNSILPHELTLGYAYQYYFDWQGTSQSTGMIAVNYRNWSLQTENDLLGAGKGWRDRFRTGAIKVQYHYQDLSLGINLKLYTGDYASCTKKTNDENYPARFGYRLQDKAVFGDKSFGILSLEGQYNGPYHQTAKVALGINSEKVRHAVQNKGLHDMPFYTDKMVKRQLMHIPMLQPDGLSYTFKEGQTIRPSKFYYCFSLNPTAFY